MVFKFKFQTFVDLQTRADTLQVIQWSVGGAEVVNRCKHLFGAYKYFKLGKISVKLVPASTLPVDPLQLSYDADDPQSVDPRDQMNPGLVRITNGEDVFTNVAALDATQQLKVYNAMMLDPRWSKFMLQSGFRRSAYPMYWQIGQLSQDKYPGTTVNEPAFTENNLQDGVAAVHQYRQEPLSDAAGNVRVTDGSSARGLFQVGHKGRLGFLPTDSYQDIPVPTSGKFGREFAVNNVPEVQVITCVLPKAYKTLYFYRCFITQEVLFAGIRSAPFYDDLNNGYRGLDQFVGVSIAGVSPGTPWGANFENDKMNNGDQMP